jgi:diaminopimelate dehydrogenase
LDAIQYTVPVDKAMAAVRNGENPDLTVRQKHIRECYVVISEHADPSKIEDQIKNMPDYFADYDTIVYFISEEEMKKNHSGMGHGGTVIRSGRTGESEEMGHIVEYSIRLDSNPEFTASVLVAYARAAYRLSLEGVTGAKTVFDIPPGLLSIKTEEQLRKELL